jgi:serine/threonine-protein kinase RsbW
MATVDVTFSPLPAHVRTARLVALAVARRIGVRDEVLDEVRLAVGEACSRAVGVNARFAPPAPVSMRLSDDGDRFTVEVIDCGAYATTELDDAFVRPDPAALSSALAEDDAAETVSSGFGLVVIGGLVEHVVVSGDDAGTRVTMSWPAAAPTD